MVVFYSVVRDKKMYEQCVGKNKFIEKYEKHIGDNTSENKPIPIHYNNFLEKTELQKDTWIVFMHEDFEFSGDPVPEIEKLRKDSIYGLIGTNFQFLIGRQFVGDLYGGEKTEMTKIEIIKSHHVKTNTLCDCLDCCCLIVNMELISKYGLRFDENLQWDMYVEDFSLNAKVKYQVPTRIATLENTAIHHSPGNRETESFKNAAIYMNQKYRRHFFTGGTCYPFIGQKISLHSIACRLFSFSIKLVSKILIKREK